MNFGEAIKALKAGHRVCRPGRNGRGMWLIYIPGADIDNTPGTVYYAAGIKDVKTNPHIDLMTATGRMQPGWTPSQEDMLAEDWEVLNG